MPDHTAPPDRRTRLARAGEDLACELLRRQGLTIVERNWRCREGEIDILARGDGLLVVCEVKTRRGSGYGGAAAAVTAAKQLRLRRLAGAYLRTTPGAPLSVRFDVVAITWPHRATFSC
ncbi:MAG TPA: YraN family protein [Actinomycetes bacterium]|nr:YraN family protein [Actinomycetes bacterium]